MVAKILAALIGVFVGGWMIFDGIHVMVKGKYFGPEKPGPWSIAFVKLGVDPMRLGPGFVALGILWLVFLAGVLSGQTWGRYGALIVAAATLWYLPVGTVLSGLYMALVLWFLHF